MRRMFSDALISVGAVLLLMVMLAAFDDRVRDQIRMRVDAGAASQAADAGATVRHLAGAIFTAVRDQSLDHAPLMLFVFAAVVLVLFMLRT